jgi:hypothetical protein
MRHFLHIKCHLTYPRRIRRRSNLGHIFRGKKSASYGPGYTVILLCLTETHNFITVCQFYNTEGCPLQKKKLPILTTVSINHTCNAT